jgi:hypothetical protein
MPRVAAINHFIKRGKAADPQDDQETVLGMQQLVTGDDEPGCAARRSCVTSMPTRSMNTASAWCVSASK